MHCNAFFLGIFLFKIEIACSEKYKAYKSGVKYFFKDCWNCSSGGQCIPLDQMCRSTDKICLDSSDICKLFFHTAA